MTLLNQKEREASTLQLFLFSSLQHLESDDGEFLTHILQQSLAPAADLPRQQASSLVCITQGQFWEVNKGRAKGPREERKQNKDAPSIILRTLKCYLINKAIRAGLCDLRHSEVGDQRIQCKASLGSKLTRELREAMSERKSFILFCFV